MYKRHGQDGNVSPEDFEQRYTSELANEFGNLASRSLAMVNRYRDGEIPRAEIDPALGAPVLNGVVERFDTADLTGALADIWALVRRLNGYVQEREPWQLSKDPEKSDELDTVLYTLAEGLRVAAVLALPFMPEACGKLLEALGADDSLDTATIGAAPGGRKIGELAPLFPRVEAPE